jgi:hypothetical protein
MAVLYGRASASLPFLTIVGRAVATKAMAQLEGNPRCGPRYDACAASFLCQYELRQAVRLLINGAEVATAKFESTLCSKSPELQVPHDARHSNSVYQSDEVLT